MKKIISSLLISLLLTISFASANVFSAQDVIYVDDDNIQGPWDGTLEHPYQFIQDGIDASKDDDIVFVFNGIYNENITIDKQIILAGENRDNTVIDGIYSETIINVTSDNVQIKDFIIKNSCGYDKNAGIKLKSNNSVIKNCIIYRTRIGIYIFQSGNNEIIDCILHTNGNGVFLNSSINSSIENCQFCHNSIGINVKNSQILRLVDSYIHTCGIGVYIEESELIEIYQSAICDTNDNGAGIFIFRSKNVAITNSNFFHNGNAIEVDTCSDILISKCTVTYNTHLGAIKVENSADKILIKDCKVSDNFEFAFRIMNSATSIRNNNIYNNKLFGVYSENSKCDIRKNWWGFFTAPAFTEFGTADRITRRFGKVFYFPWKIVSFKNAGSNWCINDKFEKIILPDDTHLRIVNSGNDTDNDGCTNEWELKWGYDPLVWDDHSNLDLDEDGLNNIEECYTYQWNSSPFVKDVFLEIDWLASLPDQAINKPSFDLIEEMKLSFQKHNINLHVDIGNMGGGEEIKYKEFLVHSDITDYYWDYFLHNDLNNPRKGIFHYGLITNYNIDESQIAMGWDHLDYLIVDAQGQRERHPTVEQEKVIVYPIMHELGHTFELIIDVNKGIDNLCAAIPFYRDYWKYSNYKSPMNYRYTYTFLDYSDGTHGCGDFNDWENLNFLYFKNTIIEL